VPHHPCLSRSGNIIRFATLAPSIFDTSLTSPLDDLWDPWPEVSQVDPRAVKLPVSMVCRAWREIAKKYLFETVYLDSDSLGAKMTQTTPVPLPFDSVRYLQMSGGLESQTLDEALLQIIPRSRKGTVYRHREYTACDPGFFCVSLRQLGRNPLVP
jgi:hypothetical protein